MGNSILVFAPHPDDDVLGCAGSICKHLRSNVPVKIVYMTNGERGVRNTAPDIAANIRKHEAIAALSHMGNVEVEFLGLKDGSVCEDETTLRKLIRTIRETRPERIYLPHEHDRHPDHQSTYHIVLKAAEYASHVDWAQYEFPYEWRTEELWCYEIWTPITYVDVAEDITEYIEQKVMAIREHKSQIEKRDFAEAIMSLNRYRAVMQNVGKYCEVFKVIKASHTSDKLVSIKPTTT